MFQMACQTIQSCLCRYWGIVDDKIRVIGSGCLLASDLVLMARHLVIDTQTQGGEPTIFKRDGVFQCRIEWDNANSDLVLLRTVNCTKQSSQPPPTQFPVIGSVLPNQGMLLGYMACLRREGAHLINLPYFSSGHVSFIKHSDHEAMRYVFSGGIIEGGFSGGPVFQPNGSIIGVLVSAFQTQTQGLIVNTLFTLPEFVSTAQFVQQIAKFAQ